MGAYIWTGAASGPLGGAWGRFQKSAKNHLRAPKKRPTDCMAFFFFARPLLGPRYNRTSPQPPVLFCFGLFWSTHKTDAFCLFCRPLLFLGGRRRRGRGREGPPAAGLASFGGPRQNPRRGPRKKSRKYQRSRLQQNICSARRSEPRDLWPNAQPAPRLHRRTSFCLREQAVSTLYVPRRGSALCSTPAASWLPRSRTRPSRQRRCICSTY